ncbi:McrC family protein [Streptomyces sp. NPDC054863]
MSERTGKEPDIRLRQSEPWTEWQLNREQARELSESELVEMRPARSDDLWKLRARDKVGVVRLGRGAGRVRLSIAPKVTVDRLMYLLGYAPQRLAWQKGQVEVAARPDLLPAIAHGFTRAAQRALRAGVLLGYREVDDTLPLLRGRLRAAAQLSRRPGLALPLEVTYDDHTTDIPENRLLLGAVRRLLRVPGVDPVRRAELQGIAVQLDGVTPPVPGTPLPTWQRTRLNLRYQPVLALAALIMGGSSYELENGRTVTVDGLVFQMWRVYEDFMARAVGEALVRTVGGRAKAADTSHHLDAGKRHKLELDLVHYLPGPDGVDMPVTVVDAKYKKDFVRDDLYQVLVYCVRLGLSDGHLVYAPGRPNASGRPSTVRVPVPGGEIRLHRHCLDLTLPYAELEARVEQLAQLIARTDGTASGRLAAL